MIRALVGWWYARLRRLDLEILWPTCKREAEAAHPEAPLEWAKAAFCAHATKDPAWLFLGWERIVDEIDALT